MSRPDRRAIGVGMAAVLLGWLAAGGATGAEPPQRLAGRFADAVDAGDVAAVQALLADDPTVVTWLPALPRAPNTATMALLDVGRARDMPADRTTIADYLGYHRELGGSTELLGCDTAPPRSGSQERLYECGWTAGSQRPTSCSAPSPATA